MLAASSSSSRATITHKLNSTQPNSTLPDLTGKVKAKALVHLKLLFVGHKVELLDPRQASCLKLVAP